MRKKKTTGQWRKFLRTNQERNEMIYNKIRKQGNERENEENWGKGKRNWEGKMN